MSRTCYFKRMPSRYAVIDIVITSALVNINVKVIPSHCT